MADDRDIHDLTADLLDAFGPEGAQAIVSLAHGAQTSVVDERRRERESGAPPDLDAHAVAQLVALVERFEELIARRDEIARFLRDLTKFAKLIGFDPRQLRAVVAARAEDETLRHLNEATLEVYRHALGITGPDFVIPLPRASLDVPRTRRVAARERQVQEALALIAANRATSLN